MGNTYALINNKVNQMMILYLENGYLTSRSMSYSYCLYYSILRNCSLDNIIIAR